MLLRLIIVLFLATSLGLAADAAKPVTPPPPAEPLVWDSMEKTLEVKPGDGAADFEFHVTNKSDQTVQITEIRPTCGCTVAAMPSSPWILESGAKGSFRGTIDLRGKHGRISKSLWVTTSFGTQILGIVVNLPEASRDDNIALAKADRQAVFKGDCASCHAAPAHGKKGAELFAAVCGVCHLAAHRNEMVPDLGIAREPRDAGFWRKWILDGKEGTLMPAFAQKHGGPLTDDQVTSLVEYALQSLPRQPVKQ
jgi:mono/diheme cytochrome c family protein